MATYHEQPWFNYPEFHWKEKTATVIGAGIAGCQVAWHLAERGWEVTVIERHPQPAQEASGNQAGIISPKITTRPGLGEDFYRRSFSYLLSQLDKLDNKILNWHPTGVLQLAYKERDQQRWQKILERLSHDPDLAKTLQCLDKHKASQVAHIPIHHNALFFPKAGWIEPASLCNALLAHCNIQLVTHTEVIQLKPPQEQKGLWTVKNSSQHMINQSEAVIICSGKSLDFPEIKALPSIPIAGQTSLATSGLTDIPLKTVIDHKGYITPPINTGHYLLGATYHLNSLDTDFNHHANRENLDKQRKYLPELTQTIDTIQHGHAAIRRVTPDRFPYVGAVPRLDRYIKDYADLSYGRYWQQYATPAYHTGLFVSAAFGSRGLTTAGLCASLLAKIIANEHAQCDEAIIRALHPSRFCIKDLRKQKAVKA